MDDLELARRHAPIVYFDDAEPFPPQLVGYRVLRQPGPSPTFDRYLNLTRPDGPPAAAVVEYALWTDWDIQHLYELEHVWSYVDAEGRLVHAEASWHGGFGALLQDGQLAAEGARPVAYAQPGKHAMAPTDRVFHAFDIMRDRFVESADRHAGNAGVLVGRPIAGRFEKTLRQDMLANAFMRRHGFQPTFCFDRRWDALEAPFLDCRELLEQIPHRLAGVLHRLEVERSRRRVWAVLFDLGDTLMDETTEQKDHSLTTQRAELFPGAADCVWRLRRAGYLLGLVADTRPGTYRNVLRQHGILRAFDALTISEEVGCEKPDPRMFRHALDALGLRPDEAERVVMVGNNLARDVRGANLAGLTTVWLRFNERYPLEPADPAERPDHAVRSFDELVALLERLESA